MPEEIFIAPAWVTLGVTWVIHDIRGHPPRGVPLNQAGRSPELGNKAYSVSNSEIVCYTIRFFEHQGSSSWREGFVRLQADLPELLFRAVHQEC
jgi:hypothetical protein